MSGPMPSPAAAREPGVVGAFTRGLAIFRPIALAYAALLAWLDREEMDRPMAAIAVFAGRVLRQADLFAVIQIGGAG